MDPTHKRRAVRYEVRLPAELSVVRVMCSGRVEPTLILEAFAKGADGVMVLACHPGDCHYKEGNLRAFCRAELLERLIPQLGVDPARFLFDYRKTLNEALIGAYYRAAGESARKAGLGIKSEAGGPGPPIHNVPVDSLLANSAVDEIFKVGPGKSFLNQPSTLKNYKNGYYVSGVYPRYSMEKWLEAGAPPARQVLRQKTQDLMSAAKAPEEYDEFIAKGEEFIKRKFHDIL